MAASLLSTRPKNGENGGQCVEYAGSKCFGKLFGATHAKDIWTNTTTNAGAALPYKKYNTMPTPPCCIVWAGGTSGHVGVIEYSRGTGSTKRYTFSDSNRSAFETVSVVANKTEDEIKALASSFSGYVQFD